MISVPSSEGQKYVKITRINGIAQPTSTEIFIKNTDNILDVLEGKISNDKQNEAESVIRSNEPTEVKRISKKPKRYAKKVPIVENKTDVVQETNAYIGMNGEPNMTPAQCSSPLPRSSPRQHDGQHDGQSESNTMVPEFPTLQTISKYLHKSKVTADNDTVKNNIADDFATMFEIIDETVDDCKNTVAKMMFIFAANNIDFLSKNDLYALLIKAQFHYYITQRGYKELISIYDKIYNDELYKDINEKNMFGPVLTRQWMDEQIQNYQLECQHLSWRRRAKRQAPKYEVDEIVGAKDKQGAWWMSRILGVMECQEHVVYYVEFIGWGERFNEFISDGYRIESFKPRKHKYYRPAWRKAAQEITDGDSTNSKEPNNISALTHSSASVNV